MEKHSFKTKSLLTQILVLITLAAAGCSPSAKGIRGTAKNTVVEAPLNPTVSQYDALPETEKQRYEKPADVIKNKTKIIHLKGLNIIKSQKKYSLATGEFSTTGELEIYDTDEKNVIVKSQFELKGSHTTDTGSFALKTIKNSNPKIKIAAQVTCLEITDNGEFDCSEALVEFVAHYENKFYAKQTQSLSHLSKDTNPILTTQTPKAINSRHLPVKSQDAADSQIHPPTETVSETLSAVVTAVEENESEETTEVSDIEEVSATDTAQEPEQAEGDEQSLNLNPVGQLSTIDLDQLLEISESKIASQTVATATTSPTVKVNENKKVINAELKQDDKSKIIKYNQAIKLPENGRLRNATSLLEQFKTMNHQNFYKIGDPTNKKYFGTQEIVDLIASTGEKMYEETGRKIFISNLSKQNGGPVAPHKSHQNGVDVDIAYPSRNDNIDFPNVVKMKPRVFNKKLYSKEKTFNLLKIMFEQKDVPIDRIFMDKAIKADLCTYAKSISDLTAEQKDFAKKIFGSINHVYGHGNHLHLRIKCTENQPACIPKSYLKTDTCFK